MSESIVAINENESIEHWRIVPGYDGRYSASSLGRMRSERFAKGRGRAGGGRILRPWLNKGYAYIKVRKPGADKQNSLSVHQAVAIAFIGPMPEGHVVNHKNCNKSDNRPENLEYVTQAENLVHARRNGRYSPPPNRWILKRQLEKLC